MKSRNQLVVIGFIAALLILLRFETINSTSVQPPAGNNGAPNTIPPYQTCGQCHSGGPAGNATANVDFTFSDGVTTVDAANFQYELNKQYTISYTPLTNSKRYGFQMSAITSTNQNGGNLTLIDPSTTTRVATPTVYVSHHFASSFHNWTFNWTSPATNVGDISFYYVFNASDSSGTDNGDTIYSGVSVVHPAPTAIEKTEAVKNLSVFPNPVSKVLNVSFDLLEEGDLEINLFSLEGKLVKNIYNIENNSSNAVHRSLDVSELPCGVYFLNIKAGGNNSYRKVVVD